jgi:hypothetical protein
MKIQQKQMYPDTTGTTAGGTTTTPSTSTSSNIPVKDVDFLNTVEAVATFWATKPFITLVWVTQSEFATTAQTYRTVLTQRQTTGSGRSSITNHLKQINKHINDAVTEVKVYIEKKFKKANAIPEFSRYGIVKEGKNYRLPKDANGRLQALPLMLAAITKDGFDNEEYGKSFWATIATEFKSALDAANAIDSTVSGKVATKNELKKQLTKVLKALLLLIEANYPDTYKGVKREWGWKK